MLTHITLGIGKTNNWLKKIVQKSSQSCRENPIIHKYITICLVDLFLSTEKKISWFMMKKFVVYEKSNASAVAKKCSKSFYSKFSIFFLAFLSNYEMTKNFPYFNLANKVLFYDTKIALFIIMKNKVTQQSLSLFVKLLVSFANRISFERCSMTTFSAQN